MGIFDVFKPKEAEPARPRNRTACPSCGAIFAQPPKRKTKCKECGQELYVRTKQVIFDSDLLTKEDAMAADFFAELSYLGATPEDYRRTEKALEEKWGFKPKSYDVVWGISNQIITRPPANEEVYDPRSTLLHHAKMVAFAQAKYQAERGHDPSPYLQTVNNYDLQIDELHDIGITHYTIETYGCCDVCAKHQGKRFSAKQLKEKPVLPIKECTSRLNADSKHPWCLCRYSAELK